MRLALLGFVSITQSVSQSREELLTVEEFADWLKLNPQTVRNMIDRSELSAIHVGSRRVRIRESELYLFLGYRAPRRRRVHRRRCRHLERAGHD